MKTLRTLAFLCVLLFEATAAFAQYVPIPGGTFLQFSYNSGAPVANGFLCSYAAGTTNKLATYQTPSGTANTNPVVLTSGGRADVYLGPAAYKLLLFAPGIGNLCGSDVVGALIKSVDNVVDLAQLAAEATNLENVRLCGRFPGSSASAKINACIADLPATGGLADARGLEGIQSIVSTVSIPSRVIVQLGAASFGSTATPAFSLVVGSHGSSGRLQGSGASTIISYTGAGNAVEAFGTGQTLADVRIEELQIIGTSSGISGIHLKAFNQATITNVHLSGFTAAAGAGILNEGANVVTCFSCLLRDNTHGLHNVGVVVATIPYAANAVTFYGGQIIANAGWGVWEDGALSATVGANTGNRYFGMTFQDNGTNATATTGNFFLQECFGCAIIGSYFEYGVKTPPSSITVGDGTYVPQGNSILSNVFLSSGGITNTISNVNGTKLFVEGNQESAVPTNFLLNGAAARTLRLGPNSSNATNYFAGADTAVDSYVFGATGTTANGTGTTARGMGFNVISGLNQDLAIRCRAGGTNCATFQNIDGTTAAAVIEGGRFTSTLYGSLTNCADGAGTIDCAAAPAGRFVIAASATAVTVNTTAVTANSEIMITRDESLATALGVTCNTEGTLTLGSPRVTGRTAGVSFQVQIDVAPTTNPLCISYSILN